VLVVLVGAGLLLVPRAAEVAAGLLGLDATVGQVAISLALAVLVVPAHQRLRPQIERVFFAERYALDRGSAELLLALTACPDPRSLAKQAGEGLHRLLRPELCVVYLGAEGSYAPVFVAGRAVPPAFEAGSSLVAALLERGRPLALGTAGRRADPARLGDLDRAALETLGAEVVVPVRRRDALLAFVCLGPKGSGDVYTPTDLAHLAALGERLSAELLRFEDAEIIRQARAMQEALRRYVPGAVPRRGDLLDREPLHRDGLGDRAEARGLGRRIQRRWHDDGLRVTPGAGPQGARGRGGGTRDRRGGGVDASGGRPGRADAALGRRGHRHGRRLRRQHPGGDRMIWSAIGNTTNLAARLQSLTRDLDASLVIEPGRGSGHSQQPRTSRSGPRCRSAAAARRRMSTRCRCRHLRSQESDVHRGL
jgi:hypothetical protein